MLAKDSAWLGQKGPADPLLGGAGGAATNVGQVCNLSGQVTDLSYEDPHTLRAS